MGTAASSSPEVGVAINPRVEYASKRAQSEGKSRLIDAPVLVDLPDGTIRYRYVDKQQYQPAINDSALTLQEADGPHRGNQDLEYKKGYFFHARLADYSTEANETQDEATYKFKYVFKGPICAKNKRLYYVTGKGMHMADGARSYSSNLNTPTWPNIRKLPSHVYYSLEFLTEDNDSMAESMDISEDINSNVPIVLKIDRADSSIEILKEKVSMLILKPTTQIAVFYSQHEIRPGTEIDGLASGRQVLKHQFKVKLSKI